MDCQGVSLLREIQDSLGIFGGHFGKIWVLISVSPTNGWENGSSKS